MPFFSIISVVFNDLDGLRRTEASVRAQTASDLEWIVVDGASSDGTSPYLQSLDLPFLTWSSESDRGIYDAMNKGTARATGKYIVYLNAGDAFTDQGCLTMIRQTLENAGNPDLCYAGANYRFVAGHSRYRPPRPVDPAIWHGLPGVHQATFYRREFLEVPPYDLQYTVSSDYYVSARCYLRGARACYLDRAVTEFMVGGTSTKHANRSLLECWRLQRDVLKMGLIPRLLSGLRRFVAHRVNFWLNSRKRRDGAMITALFRLQR